MLSRTFRHAIEVGKRARTETAIGRHAVSVSSAAVSLANSRLGTLDDRRVLVLGAGEMGEGMALALAGAGVLEIVVANRTMSRGEELARRVGGRSISLDEVPAALVECDVLLVSTGATDLLMERSQVEQVMERRGGRALLVVDVGVPRNIDPGAGEVFGVDLLDIDDLRALGEHSLAQRRQEIGKVRDLIAEELDRHRLERSAREVAPLVTALRARAEELRTLELERHRSKLAALDPAAREVIEAITQGVVNKLLHEPTIRVKDAAGTARGRALRRRAGRAVRSAGASRRPRRLMLRLATRGSALARWQAERVVELLGGDVELVIVKTSGDQRTDVPIHELGGTGMFVKEVQQAVLDGRADLAQHSAKDLPADHTRRPRARGGARTRRPA